MSASAAIDGLIGLRATFAAFRLPGEHAAAYVQRGPGLHAPRPGERGFILAPFEADAPLASIRPEVPVDLDRGAGGLPAGLHAADGPQAPAEGLDRTGYARAVQQALAAIAEGGLEKAVLARTFTAPLHGLTPGQLFEVAAQALPGAFIALVRTARHGLWLGASPEKLLIAREGRVEVDALAGTLPAGQAPAASADWGAKEREEQAVVTRMALATLEAHGVTGLYAEGPRVKQAGPVAHLHTRITGTAGPQGILPLAAALHPTPAVGGWPRHGAQALIRALEPRPRGLYAGYWGPAAGDEAQLYVNIRCMELFTGRALLHAGAGITRGSDPERECDEVERKARTWLDLMDALRRRG